MDFRRITALWLASLLLIGCSEPVQREPGSTGGAKGSVQEQPSVRQEFATGTESQEQAKTVTMSLYAVEDLLAGKTEPAGRWALPEWPTGVTIRSDRSQALLYPADHLGTSPGPLLLIDLTTGQSTPLPVDDADPWFVYAGWLRDGRILLAGRSVWLGTPDRLQLVATGSIAWTARRAPDERHLAQWGPMAEGQVELVDLATGEVSSVTGPFRRGAQDGSVSIAWSPDGTALAGSDHDSDVDGRNPRIRVVDPFTGTTIRTHQGVVLIDWLPSGEMLAWRPPATDPKEGGAAAQEAKGQMILIAPDGAERHLLDGYAAASPDGHWLLQTRYEGQRPIYALINAATGARTELALEGTPRWTAQGDLMVISRR